MPILLCQRNAVHLNEDTLATFVQGSLAPEEVHKVEQHLHACSICLELVGQVARAVFRSAGGGAPAADTPEPHLPRGAWIGRYVLLELLGSGGMAKVYTAYDSELNRKVALKVVGRYASQEHRDRLLHEAKSMAQLRHPNVVTVFGVGVHASHTLTVDADKAAALAPTDVHLQLLAAAAHRWCKPQAQGPCFTFDGGPN